MDTNNTCLDAINASLNDFSLGTSSQIIIFIQYFTSENMDKDRMTSIIGGIL
jgi:phosphoribosylaminoimidazole (AIR) synthetase